MVRKYQEVLRIRMLRELYERLAPEALLEHLPLKGEVESIPFPKYSLKMATGTGKTSLAPCPYSTGTTYT